MLKLYIVFSNIAIFAILSLLIQNMEVSSLFSFLGVLKFFFFCGGLLPLWLNLFLGSFKKLL